MAASTPKCKKGEVWDKKLKKCVAPKYGMLDDDNIYEAGHDLAMAGRYDEAIAVLSLAANKQDPRILNYLGYSHRHSGRVTVGLGYYEEALRINPDYTLVREYLGEAHLQIGDLAGAQEQLGRDREAHRQRFARIRHAGRTDLPFHEELTPSPTASRAGCERSQPAFCCLSRNTTAVPSRQLQIGS